MTCRELYFSKGYDVNCFVFYAILKNFWSLFTIYVKLSNEDISLIRHLDRNEWNEWSESSPNFACIQAIVGLTQRLFKSLIWVQSTVEISYFCFSKSKCIVDTFDKYSNIICIWIILCFLKIFKKFITWWKKYIKK